MVYNYEHPLLCSHFAATFLCDYLLTVTARLPEWR